MINAVVRKAVAHDCLMRGDEEACGFIINDEIFPCENRADNPSTEFLIAAEDYARVEALGEIECVYHSHINGNEKFSLHDVNVCKHSNLPWLLFTNSTGNFRYADPTGKAPYIGRDWAYGIHDCYSLMRDFYKRELGIDLDDFERGEEGEWESTNWTMFMDNYKAQGFVEIDKPTKTGDFLLMNIVAPSANHAGVFLAEQNCFYHHLMDRQSERTVWGQSWSKYTSRVLRHESLL